MMKPDFNSITLKEFRKYLKANRQDREAWNIYLDRMDRESTKISFPPPKSLEDVAEAINSNPEVKAKFGA